MATSTVDHNAHEMVLRGEAILRCLRLRQRAAEMEAAAIELEHALDLAEQGDSSKLDLWLRRHPDPLDSSRSPFESSPFERSPFESSQQPTNSGGVALERPQTPIEPRRVSSRVDPAPTNVDHVQAVPVQSSATIDQVLCEMVHSPLEVEPVFIDRPESAKGLLAEKTSNATSPWDDLIQAMEDEPQAEARQIPFRETIERTSQSSKPKRTNLPSWMVSLIVHAVVLLALGWMTIHTMNESKVVSITSATTEVSEVVLEPISEEPSEEVPSDLESLDAINPVESLSSELAPNELRWNDSTAESLVGQPVSLMNGVADAPSASSIASKVGAQFFGAEAAGNTFCFVVDSSGSMRRGGAFEQAKEELLRSISGLKPTQRYFVYFFSEEVEALSLDGKEPERFPIYATPENIQATWQWIQTRRIRGGRAPNDALSQAIELEPDAIFLLFDGDTKVDVAAHLRKTNRVDDLLTGEHPRISIHVIGFASQDHEDLLYRIAEENRGTYRFVPNLGKKSQSN